MAILEEDIISDYQDKIKEGPLLNTNDEDDLTSRIDKFDNLDEIESYWNDSIKDFYNNVHDLLNSDDFPLENKLSDIRDAGNAFDDYETPVYNEDYSDYETKTVDGKEVKQEGNPYVRPNINWINEEYLKARADEIEDVLQDDSHLDFTIGDYQEISDTLRKYVTRLLMPQFKRGVEVEDLDRNFWVIGQNLTMLNKFFLSLEDVFSKQIIAELMGLWDNVYRIWQAIQKLIDDFNEKANNEEWADEKVHVIMRYDNIIGAHLVNQSSPRTFYLMPYNKYITELLDEYTNDEDGLQEALIKDGPVMIEHTGYHRKMSEVLQSIKEKNFILIGYSTPGQDTIWDLLSITYKDEDTISTTFQKEKCYVCNKSNKAQHIWIDFVSDNFNYGQIASYTETNYGDLSNLLSYDVNLTIPIYRNWNNDDASIGAKCKYSDFIRINKPYPKLSAVQIAKVGDYINSHINSLNNPENWFTSSDGNIEKTINKIASNNDQNFETVSKETGTYFFIPGPVYEKSVQDLIINGEGDWVNKNDEESPFRFSSSFDENDFKNLSIWESDYLYYSMSDLSETGDFGDYNFPSQYTIDYVAPLYPDILNCPVHVSYVKSSTTTKKYTETYDNNNGIKITRKGESYYIDGFWNIDLENYYNSLNYEDLYSYNLSSINTNNFTDLEGSVVDDSEEKILKATKLSSGNVDCSYQMNFDNTNYAMLDITSKDVTDYDEMTLQYIITSYTTGSDTMLEFSDELFDSHIASSDLIDYQHDSPEGQTKYNNKYGYTSDPVINLRYINGRKHDSQEIEIVTTKDKIEKPLRYNPIIDFETTTIGGVLSYDFDDKCPLEHTYLILSKQTGFYVNGEGLDSEFELENINETDYKSLSDTNTLTNFNPNNYYWFIIDDNNSPYYMDENEDDDSNTNNIYKLDLNKIYDDNGAIRKAIKNKLLTIYTSDNFQEREFKMIITCFSSFYWIGGTSMKTAGNIFADMCVVYKYNNEMKINRISQINQSFNFYSDSAFQEAFKNYGLGGYIVYSKNAPATINSNFRLVEADQKFKRGVFKFNSGKVIFQTSGGEGKTIDDKIVYAISGKINNQGEVTFDTLEQNTPFKSYTMETAQNQYSTPKEHHSNTKYFYSSEETQDKDTYEQTITDTTEEMKAYNPFRSTSHFNIKS